MQVIEFFQTHPKFGSAPQDAGNRQARGRRDPRPSAGGQRRAPVARRLDEDVMRRVVSDIRSRDRRASFTAAELRNTLATSGSK